MAKKTAKKSTTRKTATTTRRRAVTKREAPKKRSSKSSGKKLRSDKNKRMMIQVGTALLFGALEAKGTVKDLPHIQALGIAGTYGAAGIAAGIYTKNPLLEDIGTALAILGARNLGYIKSVEEPKQATSGVYSDVGEIPAAAQVVRPGIVGVDPKLLADAATVLEELSGDDDEVEGDDDDDVSGAYDDVGATYADVSGDDDDGVEGDDDEE